jgi:hypothetical protein
MVGSTGTTERLRWRPKMYKRQSVQMARGIYASLTEVTVVRYSIVSHLLQTASTDEVRGAAAIHRVV